MGTSSKIEWTDTTWNPVVGCSHVSAGCDGCYAARDAAGRLKNSPIYAGLATKPTPDALPRFTGEIRLLPDRLDQPLHWRDPRRVFVNSMSDLFHRDIPDEYVGRVWQTIGLTPEHTYQILTKRPDRMASWLARWTAGEIVEPYSSRAVAGFPGYMVDTLGHVHGPRATLAPDVGEKGHARVTLYRGSDRERVLVHRLVLETFGRRARAGEQACHRNGDATDNRLSNLRWGTQSDNWRDRIAHGNGRSYAKLNAEQVVEIRNRAGFGESAASLGRSFDVSDTQIRNIVAGRQWTQASVPGAAVSRPVLDNCWVGTSVENQRYADLRIPHLLRAPAAVRFLSVEPLLGPVDLEPWLDGCGPECDHADESEKVPGIDWVIVGGESGPRARPMHPEWVRSIRDECVDAGIPWLLKQWGEWAPSDQCGVRNYKQSKHRFAYESVRFSPDGTPYDPVGTQHPTAPGGYAAAGMESLIRVGKKAAGRELDGRTWDEYPTTGG